MTNFFAFLDQNRGGITVLGLCVVFIVLIVQWLLWIFNAGRFKKPERAGSRAGAAQFVFGEFLAKVISDFRNLLAVLIVLVFALSLTYAMLQSQTQDELFAALQAVMSTVGVLVGSIVGYYFGESAVKGSAPASPPVASAQNPMQSGQKSFDDESIEAVPAPPATGDDDGGSA